MDLPCRQGQGRTCPLPRVHREHPTGRRPTRAPARGGHRGHAHMAGHRRVDSPSAREPGGSDLALRHEVSRPGSASTRQSGMREPPSRGPSSPHSAPGGPLRPIPAGPRGASNGGRSATRRLRLRRVLLVHRLAGRPAPRREARRPDPAPKARVVPTAPGESSICAAISP